jgi:lipopolysaccharide export LptBFGC system permease protein LptF
VKGLDRYIWRELGWLFLSSFGLFAVAFTAVDSVSEVSKHVMGLGPWIFVKYLLFRALAFQGYVVPMAYLLATLLVYSRLAREGELLGLEVSGISRARVARPALLLAVLVTTGSLICQEVLATPAAQESALMLSRAEQSPDLVFKGISSGPETLSNGQERLLVAHSLDYGQGKLKALFLHFFFEGRRVMEIYVESASWEADASTWRLEGVRKMEFTPDQARSKETQMAELTTALDLLGVLPDPKSLLKNQRQLQTVRALVRRLDNLPSGSESLDEERRMLWLEVYQRLALAASTLVFCLAALPIAMRSQRTGMGHCLGSTVILALLYYFGSALTVSLSEAGRLSPLLGAWAPNLALGFFALAFAASRSDVPQSA